MEKKINGSTLGWISRIAGKNKIFILLLVVTHILQAGCGVAIAVALKQVVDKAVTKDISGFKASIIIFVLIIAVNIAFSLINKFLGEYICASFENVFKRRLTRELFHRDYGMVTASHSAQWMNRLTSDTVVVADGLTHILPGLAGMLIRLVGALVLLVMYLPKIAYIVLPGGVILLILTYCIRKVMKKLHKSVQEADGDLRVFLQENLGSMIVVRAFGRETEAVKGAERQMAKHKGARMKRAIFSNFCNLGFATVMNGVYVLCVAYCCIGIIKGTISYGTLMAIMQLVGQVQTPLASITGVLPKYYAMTASAERLMEVESYDKESENCATAEEINDFYENHFASFGIKEGSFSYISDDKKTIIDNIDIAINKGEFVAFTGPSGCGKSTLLKLFMCLYPLDSGITYINDGNNCNAYDSYYKKLFAYVPQGNHLMSGTIREVVTFFDKENMYDDEGIRKSLKVACAEHFVEELSEGLDTMLGERGAGLSEGQMQRIAIARAVYAGCPVLILDEATSALDEATEKAVLENLKSMTEKTVIVVTHRPAALEICDREIEL